MVLDSRGQLTQQGTYEDLRSQEGFISSLLLQPPHTDDNTQTPSHQDSKIGEQEDHDEDDAMDLTRKTGDVAIYSYYLQSFGWVSALIFFGCAAGSSFTLSFPREQFV